MGADARHRLARRDLHLHVRRRDRGHRRCARHRRRAALGYWGYKAGGTTFTRILLGVGAPGVAIALWWAFVSPNAPVDHALSRGVVEALVFGAAVLALFGVDRPQLAVAFALVALVDSVLVRLLDA
ncbi:MAG TPA: YrdB family protein [Gaiellaceae bacterium]|nr:YrdB family protein [Gaiellaceae bacterium]